jgi:hypothetical protein
MKHMMLPRSRAYVDWTVPLGEGGKECGVCTDEAGYRHYLKWLADYLFTQRIPVPSSQRALVKRYRKLGAAHAVIDLSDELGYSIWATDILERQLADGKSYAEIHQRDVDAWNELSEEERRDWTRQDCFISERDYQRLAREFAEAKKVPRHIRHADIPYRPVLAALFKDIPDPKRRYELLDLFYRNFDECASK